MEADIIVGLGYGDEGKGITTDYLCSQYQSSETCVVRFSGGQQAGHTVMLGDKKHIHASFGSGTLRGIDSYFTEHTTVYPVSLINEFRILQDLSLVPKLFIHPLAKITTPYDVWNNRECKTNILAGTCGMGVGKTMKRNEGPCKLHAIDLLNRDVLENKLEAIGKYYWEFRRDFNNIEFDKELKRFYRAVATMKTFVTVQGYEKLYNYHNLVFEGSQGILLDMDHGVFPHVTYANTTSKNAIEVCNFLNIGTPTVYYITRGYSTRHGKGPFEEKPIHLINTEEETCVENRWQREFKIAPIDYDKLNYAIKLDQQIYSRFARHCMVVTCIDQIEPNSFKHDSINVMFEAIYESHSPYSKDFKKIN